MNYLAPLTIAIAAISAANAYGGSLQINGFVRSGGGTTTFSLDGGSVATDFLSDSGASPASQSGNRGSSSAYSAFASFGHLSSNFSASAFCADISCGVETADGNFGIFVLDLLTFTGISNGVLALDVFASGHASGFIGGGLGYEIGRSNVDTALMAILSSQPGTSTTLYHGSTASASLTGSDYLMSGTALIPFTGGSLALGQQMYGGGEPD